MTLLSDSLCIQEFVPLLRYAEYRTIVRALFAKIHVFHFPTVSGADPIVLLEAFAAGLHSVGLGISVLQETTLSAYQVTADEPAAFADRLAGRAANPIKLRDAEADLRKIAAIPLS